MLVVRLCNSERKKELLAVRRGEQRKEKKSGGRKIVAARSNRQAGEQANSRHWKASLALKKAKESIAAKAGAKEALEQHLHTHITTTHYKYAELADEQRN